MSLLYVNDSGATIGIEGNCCTVKQKDGSKRMLPIESLDGITIMGQSQMTTQCAEECMQRGIPVSYFSKGGKYFGRLISTGHVNVERQRKQCALYDTGFAVELAMKILSAKIKNPRIQGRLNKIPQRFSLFSRFVILYFIFVCIFIPFWHYSYFNQERLPKAAFHLNTLRTFS